MSQTAVELPLYQCHKQVRAAKITGVEPQNPRTLTTTLQLGDIQASTEVSAEWHAKHEPTIGSYYVVYADGYTSCSPAKAFEEGYARVPVDDKDRVRLEHADLDAKITKLEAYLDNPANEFVTGLSLLHDQLNAMRRYAHILTQRIAGF
jgi:hypothetical protein